jgi:hypothetical protein
MRDDRFEGYSDATKDSDAGFRRAAQDAVEKYKAQKGAPKQGEPVRLKVTDMYVDVQNPIHGFIVVLGPGG